MTRTYPSFWGGSISEIAVMQSHRPVSKEDFSLRFGGLLTGFPDPLRFYWLYPGQEHFGTFQEHAHSVVSVPLYAEGWRDTWIQDPFHLDPDPSGKLELFMPLQSPDSHWEIAKHLAFAAELPLRPVGFYLEGGNMIRIEDILLCGADLIWQNAEREGLTLPELERSMEKVVGFRELRWIGLHRAYEVDSFDYCGYARTHQPFFHLDLFILPLGRSHSGKIQIGLAEIRSEFVLGMSAAAPGDLAKLRDSLEIVREQLEALPLGEIEVVRIPVLLGMNGRFLRLYSHCNGYVQPRGGHRLAILPDYRMPDRQDSIWRQKFTELGEAVESILAHKGIRTAFIDGDFLRQANDCGSLHCRTKVIRYKH